MNTRKQPLKRVRRSRYGQVGKVGLGLFCLSGGESLACSSCSTGDPTMTVMGTELPFEGRKRISLETRARGDAIGDPQLEGVQLQEVRTDLNFAYTPSVRWTFSASLPLMAREVTYVNLAQDRVLGLGDLELRVRRLVWRDRSFMPQHLVSVQAGLKLPSSPLLYSDAVQPLDSRAQLGSGAWDPSLALAYGFFASPFSAYLSVTGVVPGQGYLEEQAGASLRSSWSLQYQPLEAFSLRGGLELRWDAVNLEEGVVEPDSGGFITFAAFDLLVRPAEDWLVRVGAAVPVVQALNGYHRESPVLTVGGIYDF